MHWFKLMLLMLPALGGSGDATLALAVTDGVNQSISMAAATVAEIDPAWELALKSELADSPVYAETLVSAIEAASTETGIDSAMLWSVAFTETHGRHCRENGNVKRGGAGEVGLMQIKPFWSKALKKHHGIEVDLYDLTDNVRAGAHILLRGGDQPNVMLSYYNTGQKLKGTAYQRKVMKYWKSIEEIPTLLAVKPIVAPADRQPAAALGGDEAPVKDTSAKPAGTSKPQDEPVSSAKAKPAGRKGGSGNAKSERQDKDAPPQRSFRPE